MSTSRTYGSKRTMPTAKPTTTLLVVLLVHTAQPKIAKTCLRDYHLTSVSSKCHQGTSHSLCSSSEDIRRTSTFLVMAGHSDKILTPKDLILFRRLIVFTKGNSPEPHDSEASELSFSHAIPTGFAFHFILEPLVPTLISMRSSSYYIAVVSETLP